jgi:NhaP-type Na+/H+ or K+/H+ antiporter
MRAVEGLGVAIGISGAAGAFAFVVADRLKIPGILFYLAFGLALGPAGLGIVEAAELHSALPVAVPVAVAIILFEGGLSLDLDAIRGATGPLRNLLTIGVIVSFMGGTLIAWQVGGLSLHAAAIFGALMTVTGPTVITPILRRVSLRGRVRALLQWESILVDPIGVITAVLIVEYATRGGAAGAAPALRIFVQLFGGTLVGAIVGVGTGLLLRRRYFGSSKRADAANVTAVGAALGAYAVGEVLVHEGGIVSATTAGFVLSMFRVPWLRGVRHFKEQVTTLLVATLFVLIAASIDPREAVAQGWRVWVTVALVALVLRPTGVLLSTINSGMPLGERLYVAWIGPRGIIAAAGAALSAIKLRQHGVAGGEALEALVFATIAITVAVQGLSAGAAARLLRVHAVRAPGLAIAGASALAQGIARCVQAAKVPVRLLDTNPARCVEARFAGLDALQGSASDAEDIAELCDERGRFLALTPNSEVNTLAALHAREHVGTGYAFRVTLPTASGGARMSPLSRDDIFAFTQPVDVARMSSKLVDGLWEVVTEEAVEGGPVTDVEEKQGGMILVVLRDDTALIATRALSLRQGEPCVVLRERSSTA